MVMPRPTCIMTRKLVIAFWARQGRSALANPLQSERQRSAVAGECADQVACAVELNGDGLARRRNGQVQRVLALADRQRNGGAFIDHHIADRPAWFVGELD